MAQSKPVKKKKKTKIGKPKNGEKKVESPQPLTPVEKRKLAENNVREMIKEAYKMHKNHTRTPRAFSTPTSKHTIGKSRVPEKSAEKSSSDERYLSIEMTQRRKTINESTSEISSFIQIKSRQKEGASRKSSIESGKKKIEVDSSRRGSAQFMRRRRKEAIPRAGSAVFPMKNSSAEFPATKIGGDETRGRSKKRRDSLLRIKDYQVGSFVSLELLDKMKNHESDTCVGSKKGILRRHATGKPKESANKISAVKTKKPKREVKKEDAVSERKSLLSQKMTEEEKRKVKRGTPSKRGKTDSETKPIKGDSRVISQTKSVISNPKSATSNLESNISSITGAGDLFSSNTSRSYFSSESDISKIDKKFMQILEAVTQTKIGLEEKAMQMAAERIIDENFPSTSKNDDEETKKRKPSELEQKLMDRINYLEQNLEISKTNAKNTAKMKEEIENAGKDYVTPKSGSKELLVTENNENDSPKSVGKKKAKNDEPSKEERRPKSNDRQSIREGVQLSEPPRKTQKSATEFKAGNVSETTKERENKSSEQKPVSRKRRRNDVKQTDDKELSERGTATAPASGTESEKGQYKGIETWSIIKRLEKAFLTLGLNLEDLENTDEEDDLAKKKQHAKKLESSGLEKRGLLQSETLRKCQEVAQATVSNIRKRGQLSGVTPFVIETNASGDKNMEYKGVKNSKKAEDFSKPAKEKKSKENTPKEAYYASVRLTPGVKIYEHCDLNGLPDEKNPETVISKSSRKRYGDGEKHAAEHGIIPKKANPSAEEPRRLRKYAKRLYKTNFDDGYIGHGKSRSECSLSVSCSASSSSESDRQRHKRKKKNHSLVREPYTHDREVLTKTNGKGDAMSQTSLPRGRKTVHEMLVERKCSGGNIKKTKANGVQTAMNKKHNIIKIEEESEELELQQIRQRHRQIISEIKLSLEEMKEQHNLCMKLRKQTKQFNRDCHAKRRILASYLKDVESSYEKRNGRHRSKEITPKHFRALSYDGYYRNRRKNSQPRGKHSDCDMQRARLQKYGRDESDAKACEKDKIFFGMIETENESSAVSRVFSSIILQHTGTDVTLTDTTEGSFRSMTPSLHTVCRKPRSKTDIAAKDGIPSVEMCLQWEGDDKPRFSEDGVKQHPNYLVQLLEKLYRIVVTEKNQLDNLVVKASTSSNHSNQSNKTMSNASAKSSGSSLHKEQHHKSSGITRPATTKNEIGSTNAIGSGSQRHHKSKGKKKTGREKSPETEESESMSMSRSYIRGDPGGRSFESLIDQEWETVISESHPIIRTDTISQCGKSCIHLEKHAEEHRYRKGDPSFHSQARILEQFGEHSRHCMERVKEDDDARKRKLELERILRVNEKAFKRMTSFGRDTCTHSLDSDPYIAAKGRQVPHTKHRQQSIIIDHNPGEENEESQTVLGHASRHVAFALRKADRKAPHEYLKADRRSGSAHLEGHHESSKKGRRHHTEEIPINFCEISVNNPGSSGVTLKDATCQTDDVDDYDDIEDMYLLEES